MWDTLLHREQCPSHIVFIIIIIQVLEDHNESLNRIGEHHLQVAKAQLSKTTRGLAPEWLLNP